MHASGRGGARSIAVALWRDPRFDTLRRRSAYMLRVLAAIAIALWLAAWLQLRNPQSAVTTVLIVANPSVGAIVSKSVWRIIGTLLGAAVAIAAFSAFGQTPWLFFATAALWVGLCCFASTVLRYFKAYGAVLSGYTLAIVAAPTFAEPDNVLISALSRLSVVVIGIIIAGAVFLLTTPQPRPGPLLARVRSLAAEAASLLELASEVPQDPAAWSARLAARRRALGAGVVAVDEQLEFLPAPDPRTAATLVRLRLACARLLGVVSGLGPIGRVAAWLVPFNAVGPDERTLTALVEQEALDRMRAALAVVADPTVAPAEANVALAEARAQFARLSERLSAETSRLHAAVAPGHVAELASDLRGLAVIDLLGLLLGRIEEVLGALDSQPPARSTRMPLRLRGFLDWRTALRNGVRGALVTLICAGFWYATEWPDGPNLLAYVVPAASLLATAPSAGHAAREFALGTAISAVASVVTVTTLLPQAVGYWQVWLAMSLMMAPFIWLQLDPRWVRISTGYLIFFSAQLGVQNPLHLNIEATLNSSLAYLLGSAMVMLVFAVLLPPNDLREGRRLTRLLQRSVEGCARSSSWSRARSGYHRGALWEHWHIQVIERLTQRAAGLPAALHNDLVDGATSSIILGRALLRLQELAPQLPAAPRDDVREALGLLRHLSRDPLGTARRVRALSLRMPLSVEGVTDEGATDDHESGVSHHVVAATLRQIADVLAAYPAFYDRAGPLQALFAEPRRVRLAHMLPAERAW